MRKNVNVRYNTLIYACAQRIDLVPQAFEYYAMALANGFRPDIAMMNSLLFACSRVGDVANAQLLFNQCDVYNLEKVERFLASSSALHFSLVGFMLAHSTCVSTMLLF